MEVIIGITLGAAGVAAIQSGIERIKACRRKAKLERAIHPRKADRMTRQNRIDNAANRELLQSNLRQYEHLVNGR